MRALQNKSMRCCRYQTVLALKITRKCLNKPETSVTLGEPLTCLSPSPVSLCFCPRAQESLLSCLSSFRSADLRKQLLCCEDADVTQSSRAAHHGKLSLYKPALQSPALIIDISIYQIYKFVYKKCLYISMGLMVTERSGHTGFSPEGGANTPTGKN